MRIADDVGKQQSAGGRCSGATSARLPGSQPANVSVSHFVFDTDVTPMLFAFFDSLAFRSFTTV